MLPRTIRTQRLVLRPHRLDDFEAMSRYMADPKFSHDAVASPRTNAATAARAWLERAQRLDWRIEPHWGVWLIDKLVGGVSLRIDHDNRRAEIAYEVSRDYRNQGIGTEAAGAVIESAFAAEPDLNRVFAKADARNQPSIRILRKLRMRYEGALREHLAESGPPVDEVRYGLLRREFERSRECRMDGTDAGAARAMRRLVSRCPRWGRGRGS